MSDFLALNSDAVFLLACVKSFCLILWPTVNVGEDCPVFDGLFEFCQLSTGGSVGMLFHLYSYLMLKYILRNK